MKNFFLSVFTTVLMITGVSAQTDFKLKPTTFVGALSDDAAADWTKGWTNFDPKNTTYPAPTDVTTLDGMAGSLATPGEKFITGSVTLDPAKVYLLQGFVVVKEGGKLVIPAGTIIRCQSDLSTTPKNYGTLVVERGGKLEINGTVDAPVVFTSNKPVGARERGDWGGILIAGKARHNLLNAAADNVQMEGFNNISFDATLAKFGGSNASDNSGKITYVRIEFPGLAFEANKEINGLTLGAVGSGTELHHIQVSYSNDDSYEWFGGSVNSSYLIAWKGTDDDFDTDNGYSGVSQFGIAVKDSAYYDLTYANASGASTSEGFESDNEATGTATVSPYTNAIFSNYTMVGPIPVGAAYSQMTSTIKSAFRRGARIRRNSSLRIANSIFMGYRNFVMVDGDSCVRNTNYPGALSLVNPSTPVNIAQKQIFFTNNLICNTAAAFQSTTDTTATGLAEVARAAGSNNKKNAIDAWLRQTAVPALANNINPVDFSAGTLLVNPLAISTTPDFRPVSGSPALSGAQFAANPILVNLTTDVHEIASVPSMPVYPNPVNGGDLQFGKMVESFGIFNLKGGLVKFGTDTDHTSMDGLEPGIYFIKIDGRAQKLIVQ